MRSKPYLAVIVGLCTAIVVFAATVFFGGSTNDEPLPHQAVRTTVEGELSATTITRPTSTTPTHETGIGAVAIDPPSDAGLRLLPSHERALDAGCDEPVVVTPPAADLAAIVAGSEPNTCFVLQPGRYQFHDVEPKDYMTFIGTARTEVVVSGSPETENAFHGTATGVSIGRMTILGFQGTGGEKRQEQAAIRGTAGIWLSDRGEMARDWLIEDIEASNNYANGLFIGDRFTVRGSRFANNGISGVGGSEVIGGLIEGNEVTRNGEHAASGFLANGAGMKFGEAGTIEEPLVVIANEIHDNVGIGLWCDIGCNGFYALDNYIHDQDSRAIMYELSANAVISGNLLVNTNTWTNFNQDFNAGAITIGESRNALVENNYIEGAVAGIIVRQTKRPVRPHEDFLDNYPDVTFVTEQVVIRNNVLVGIEAMGLSIGQTGAGIPDVESIRFDDNTYANPADVTFWWNGSAHSFESWQVSGRDVVQAAGVPARPVWPASS